MSTHNICFNGELEKIIVKAFLMSTHMFLWRIGENYPIIITKYSSLT